MDVAQGLDFGQPLDVAAVVGEPNCSVEGHFVVLYSFKGTI